MIPQKQNQTEQKQEKPEIPAGNNPEKQPERPIEKGGRKGPEPTRYGDWELNGKCVDF